MSSKNEHEKQNKLLNNDNYVNAKNKKTVPKKQQIKKRWEWKPFTRIYGINCLKNTITIKILTVL